MSVNVSEVIVKTANGDDLRLGEYRGQVLLIVNVASRCGFTKQYAGLQELQNTYGPKGFQVLGFPCNDFGAQEPGTISEIKTFCSATYNATFTLFEKVHAKGNTTEPYSTLNQAEPTGEVQWNFEKFLISKEGNVLMRCKSAIEPNSEELKAAIEKALEA
ncbi:glutathione peroxidase [Prochlorococcus sp. MIT 1307]|uniref:glutathione peroxidase n=1 Tax=Prochlorococcus sp. MIT 1307 TaxID=3096219 RepID=UPI002A75CBB3|nr:glutathione peroxidase [Prochlorococcus sp. MIT 1307]